MLRTAKLLLVLLAALTALPGTAEATVFNVNIFAQLTGTDSRANCVAGQSFPYCPFDTLPYANSLSLSLGPIDLAPGDNTFLYGGYYTTGLVAGTIVNTDGLLTGRDLTYNYAACSGPCAGDHIFASAATFIVTGGLTNAVPEPATWAMLLSGIAALGWLLRRRPRTGGSGQQSDRRALA